MKASEFADLIVATRNGDPVRLKDVATVEDSYQSVKTAGSYNGERSIVLLVQRQPNANTVEVVDAVRKLLPRFQSQVPASIKINLVNDRSVSIREAIHDVNITLALTVALVVLVIFLFLHRAAATFIPAITMPISLLGALALLNWLGYSLDNVSLLGITLAVGLVVDDAIVVLENIVRHIEMGKKPLHAALVGAKEMGFTIISISISLVAVFIPIFFMPGVIGLLFHEFAVMVGLSILVSAIVSLTLVPMLASRLLPPHVEDGDGEKSFIGRHFETGFTKVRNGYARTLDIALPHRNVVLLIALATFALTVVLYVTIPKGFFPEEDLGQIQVTTEASEDTSSAALLALQEKVVAVMMADPAMKDVTSFTGGGNSGRMFMVLEAAQRARQDAGRAGPPAQGHPRHSRHCRLPAPHPEPAAGRTPVQEPLPVHPAKRGHGRRFAEHLGIEIPGRHAQQPGLPRRHQRLAKPRPASPAENRPRQGQQSGRGHGRCAHRTVRRVRRAPGFDHLRAGRVATT